MNLVNQITQPSTTSQGAGLIGEWLETSWSLEPSWNNEHGDTSGHRYVALQPIFNFDRELVAYEALSRSGWSNQFVGNSDESTRRMVDDCHPDGLAGLTGGRPVFINCTRESLLSGVLMRLPRTTVLELLETIVPDSNVLQACWELKNLGFRIALDDFQPSEGMQEIVALADYIKVDFRLSGKTERKRIRRLLRNSCATLIAEKVETVEELETAHQENFALFQGYVLARPVVFSKRCVRIAA